VKNPAVLAFRFIAGSKEAGVFHLSKYIFEFKIYVLAPLRGCQSDLFRKLSRLFADLLLCCLQIAKRNVLISHCPRRRAKSPTIRSPRASARTSHERGFAAPNLTEITLPSARATV
jgi:hypothetical protein